MSLYSGHFQSGIFYYYDCGISIFIFTGFLKKLLTLTAEHANQRKQFGKPLSEFGLIREKVVNVAMNIYVMEAMAYTTAGLIDSGLYEDCAQEAAMVKVEQKRKAASYKLK